MWHIITESLELSWSIEGWERMTDYPFFIFYRCFFQKAIDKIKKTCYNNGMRERFLKFHETR